MLYCKYSRKVWKYLSQSELQIYFLVFIHWFLDLNFEIFSFFSHLWFGLRIFSEFFWHFTTRHLYFETFETLNFFSLRSYLSWTLKIFWNFLKPSWLELDFEIFLKFFQPCVIEVELWKFFEFFQTCTDCDWTLKIFLNMCTHMIELVYNCWTTCHWLTQLYCTWLMFPLHRFRHSIKIFSKHFIIQ